MITVTVIIVLIAIGVPSFKSTMRSSRVTDQANQMLAAFNLARTEAIRTNLSAGICPTANPTAGMGATCSAGAWNTGWLVFDDTNGNGTADAGEVVRVFTADSSMTLVPAATLQTPILFNNQAIPTSTIPTGASPPAALVLTPISCPTGLAIVRSFYVNTTGQFRTQTGNCP